MQSQIEGSTSLGRLYLNPPGTQGEGGFSDGLVTLKNGDTIDTRYVPFSGEGASLNYGWIANYLVISTSFSGMKQALEMLQVAQGEEI